MLSKERLAAIAVGDTLCIDGDEYPVIAVGRKYFKVKMKYRDVQFTLDRGWHYDPSGFSNKHQIWDTVGEYRQAKESQEVWDKLRTWFNGRYKKPEELTLESIKEVFEILTGKDATHE